jgi:signal transduction histidine kinase/ActR/RegA family two-component response regulator
MSDKKESFPLDGAKWPVLTLDVTAKVVRCNQAARSQLSPTGKDIAHLDEIWTPENGCSASDFVKRVAAAGIPTFPLRLCVKAAELKPFTAHICQVQESDRKLIILQFHGRKAAAGATTIANREAFEQARGQEAEVVPAPAIAAPAPVVETAALAGPPTEGDVVEKNSMLSASDQRKLMCALQLTRTVAMDFNNALTSILGHTTHLLNRIGPEDANRGSLEQIERSVERAAQVAFDLAAFSREERDMYPAAAASLNKLVRRVADQYKLKTDAGVAWRTSLDTKLHSATFAEAKMHQALEKVLDNAVEAVGDSGTVSINTMNKVFEAETYDGYARIVPGVYVCVEINDSGPGIPEAQITKVMEPFFTTKEGHRGLGLAWTYGLITNFSGSIAVVSEPGQGTTVRIYLPAGEVDEAEEDYETDDQLRGDQSILIVDDEELLLTMGEMVLTSYGYDVMTAANGRAALDLLEKEGTPSVDLVITDLVMPHMDGYALIENLKKHKPDLRIICCSGNFRPSNKELGITYLQKPFDSMDLIRAVRKVLKGTPVQVDTKESKA